MYRIYGDLPKSSLSNRRLALQVTSVNRFVHLFLMYATVYVSVCGRCKKTELIQCSRYTGK